MNVLERKPFNNGAKIKAWKLTVNKPTRGDTFFLRYSGSDEWHCSPFLLRGFALVRRDPFVSVKGPKTIFARTRPLQGSCISAPNKMAAQLVTLSARQTSRFGATA
jgi:hypothetical protein